MFEKKNNSDGIIHKSPYLDQKLLERNREQVKKEEEISNKLFQPKRSNSTDNFKKIDENTKDTGDNMNIFKSVGDFLNNYGLTGKDNPESTNPDNNNPFSSQPTLSTNKEFPHGMYGDPKSGAEETDPVAKHTKAIKSGTTHYDKLDYKKLGGLDTNNHEKFMDCYYKNIKEGLNPSSVDNEFKKYGNDIPKDNVMKDNSKHSKIDVQRAYFIWCEKVWHVGPPNHTAALYYKDWNMYQKASEIALKSGDSYGAMDYALETDNLKLIDKMAGNYFSGFSSRELSGKDFSSGKEKYSMIRSSLIIAHDILIANFPKREYEGTELHRLYNEHINT